MTNISTKLTAARDGVGPVAGRILAALSTDADVGHNLRSCRLNQFSDVSEIRLGPAN